jgi:hypothetical protein
VTRERLVPVASAAELSAGIVCVLRPCSHCSGSEHRFMLLRAGTEVADERWTDAGQVIQYWMVAPAPRCMVAAGQDGIVLTDFIEEGELFREADDLGRESARPAAAGRPRELVR